MNAQAVTADRSSINLLPEDVLVQRQQGTKMVVINKISILVLVILILITGGTLMLRISQESPLKDAQESLKQSESRVNSLKGRETQLMTLKQRLDSIESLGESDAKKKAIFNLLTLLIPEDMEVADISVERNGVLTIALGTSSLSTLEGFLADLSNEEKNSNLISQIGLDGLTFNKAGTYRFTLQITPK